MSSPHFATLERPVELRGVGLHSGHEVTVILAPTAEVGITFRRIDLPGQPLIPAAWDAVTDTHHATTLQAEGATVSTIEHLLAALSARGITHCAVSLDGPEVPILDGSAQPWCALLHEAGYRELPGMRPFCVLRAPVWVEAEGGASMLGLPLPANAQQSTTWHLSYAVDFGGTYRQIVDLEVTAATFEQQLAPARTFAREAWLPALRERGLIRGGTEDNALVLRSDGPSSPWRLPMELASHKALDAVGDLALLTAPTGAKFSAHIIAIRAGHGLHRAWIANAVQQDALHWF